MSAPAQRIQALVWGGLAVIVLGVVLAFLSASPLGNPPPVYGSITNFSLTNQDGRVVTEADWRGQIQVVDLVFTRCLGPCPFVSAVMAKLQAALPSSPVVQLVSLTGDPGHDTPAVLKEYGTKFHAIPGTWTFLTGSKEMMHHLAVDQLKLILVEKAPGEQENPNDVIMHSTKIVLLDAQGRIRGYFDGDTADSIPPILAAIRQLNKEH